MHELWLCKNILAIINEHMAHKPQRYIKKIYLEIGELVAVDQSALNFSFSVIAENTIAKDAVLEIIPIYGEALCDSCKKSVKISQYADSCQYCGSFSLTIMQGTELRIQSMEVE